MKEIFYTKKAPAAIGPYSQACGFGGLVFCSGQIALDADGNSHLHLSVAAQTRIAMNNMKHVLEASGSSLDHVLKVSIFLLDMADFQAVNEVYQTFFGENPPARACVAVSGLPRGAKIELECIAIQKDATKN